MSVYLYISTHLCVINELRLHTYFGIFLVSWMIKREQSRVFRDDFTWRKFKLKSISDNENDNDDDCDNDNNEKFLNFNYISGDMVIGENFSCDYHDMLGGLLCDEPGLYIYMYIYIYIYIYIYTWQHHYQYHRPYHHIGLGKTITLLALILKRCGSMAAVHDIKFDPCIHHHHHHHIGNDGNGGNKHHDKLSDKHISGNGNDNEGHMEKPKLRWELDGNYWKSVGGGGNDHAVEMTRRRKRSLNLSDAHSSVESTAALSALLPSPTTLVVGMYVYMYLCTLFLDSYSLILTHIYVNIR